MQLFDGLVIETQILLTANEDDGKALAEMKNLGDPLDRWVSNYHEVVWRCNSRSLTFSWTLSSESGESTAKQMRMT